MVACKFRSVAPTAYAQEPYVPGEPRHWELGQVRKAVCEHTCIWIPCGVMRLHCYSWGKYVFSAFILPCVWLSPQHVRLVIRRRQEKAEKGGSEKEIIFQRHLYAVVLHVAGSAGGVMIVWACFSWAELQELLPSRGQQHTSQAFLKYFQSMSTLGQSPHSNYTNFCVH